MNISTYIPASWRKPLYGAFAVAGVVIGAIQVGIAATGDANPEWLLVVLAVFPFVAGAIGFTAAANTINTGREAVGEYLVIADDTADEPDGEHPDGDYPQHIYDDDPNAPVDTDDVAVPEDRG